MRPLLPFLIVLLMLPFQNCGVPGKSQDYLAASNSVSGDQSHIPHAATGLVVRAASNQQINLTWTDNSDNESGFRIQRANAFAGPFTTEVGAYVTIATTAPNATAYSDSGLTPATIYYYRVVALNAAGAASPSNEDSASTMSNPTAPPLAPSNLAATATLATVVNLTWTDNSSSESGFKLERSANGGGTFALVATISADQTSFQDVNLLAGTAYTYRVRATNMIGDSANSASANVTTLAAGDTSKFSYVDPNIIETNCVSCHHSGSAAAGVNLDNYNSIRNLVSPGNSAGSTLYQAINSNQMPPGAPLTTLQKQQVMSWIDGGALNN